MPTLGQIETTKLDLPSTAGQPESEQAHVIVKTKLVIGDLLAINEAKTDTERGVVLLTRIIADWNFTKNGAPVPVTVESIEQLAPEDFVFLSEWVGANLTDSLAGLSKDEKKDLSSPSTPDQPSHQVTI
jgi:hypothetical protein